MLPSSEQGYELRDPRPIAAKSPYTFFLPSAEEIEAVGTDDLVKLTFEYLHETEEWGAERMWVTVECAETESMVGTLQSQPDEPTSPLKFGDAVQFKRCHILSIVWARPEAAPLPTEYREYWDRCLVDDCVLDGSKPVEYIYREQPNIQKKDNEFPDSGWRIRSRTWDFTDEEMGGGNAKYVALGAVLNRDDSWLDLLNSAIGSRFIRDFETDTYKPKA